MVLSILSCRLLVQRSKLVGPVQRDHLEIACHPGKPLTFANKCGCWGTGDPVLCPTRTFRGMVSNSVTSSSGNNPIVFNGLEKWCRGLKGKAVTLRKKTGAAADSGASGVASKRNSEKAPLAAGPTFDRMTSRGQNRCRTATCISISREIFFRWPLARPRFTSRCAANCLDSNYLR